MALSSWPLFFSTGGKMDQLKIKPEVSLAVDAWSQGQILSKMWLLEKLEPVAKEVAHPEVWILGGWYGLLAFMMFTRDQIRPHLVTSFDIDSTANSKAQFINNAWAFDPLRFTTKTADCNQMDFVTNPPDIIINTSCEHFSNSWAKKLAPDTIIALQSTDMPHAEHSYGVNNLEAFQAQYPIFKDLYFVGRKDFKYPNLEFSRFMIIGKT